MEGIILGIAGLIVPIVWNPIKRLYGRHLALNKKYFCVEPNNIDGKFRRHLYLKKAGLANRLRVDDIISVCVKWKVSPVALEKDGVAKNIWFTEPEKYYNTVSVESIGKDMITLKLPFVERDTNGILKPKDRVVECYNHLHRHS